MNKLTRGNVLATLKELKKHKRPKPATTAVAVQAICPKQVVKADRNAELRASIERRRALILGKQGGSRDVDIDKFMEEFDDGFSAFCKELATHRSKKRFCF